MCDTCQDPAQHSKVLDSCVPVSVPFSSSLLFFCIGYVLFVLSLLVEATPRQVHYLKRFAYRFWLFGNDLTLFISLTGTHSQGFIHLNH